jgi:hypothetical protein
MLALAAFDELRAQQWHLILRPRHTQPSAKVDLIPVKRSARRTARKEQKNTCTKTDPLSVLNKNSPPMLLAWNTARN